MIRSILAVIAGFIAGALVIMGLFLVLAFSLGAEGIFQPGSWKANSTVDFASLAITLVGGVVGGCVCALIARARTPVVVLVGITLIWGLLAAFMNLKKPEPGPRDSSLKPMEVMEQAQRNSKDTNWVAFCFPFIGAAGTLAGAALVKKRS